MCEFCSYSGSTADRDSTDVRFRGFFTPEAIDAAVRKAAAAKQNKKKLADKSSSETTDDDGT